MTEIHAGHPAAPPSGSDAAHPTASEDFDRELDMRGILWATVGLIVVTLLLVVAMWGMFKGFVAFDKRHAEAPPPMQGSRRQAPPEPRLQAAPPADMTAMREADKRLLEHAAWIDRAKGTVRVPIDVAIDVLVERGLPRVTTPSLADMVAHGSYASNGRPPTDQPSPGTLLAPPGMGIGSIGPPSAGAGQQFGAAMPEPAAPAGPPAAGVNATGVPRSPAPAAPQRIPRRPILPPPPPGGRP